MGRCLIALALLPAGCAATGKKNSPPAKVPAPDPARPFWADNGSPRSPTTSIPNRDPVNTPANDPEVSGILAGRVIDGFQRPVVNGSIQVIEMASLAPRPPTEIELEPNNQGRFYIRGLQPGRTYRLIARTKGNGQLLVGEVQARPPETRLLIPVSEELASGTTPNLPQSPEPLNPKNRPAPPPSIGNEPANDAPNGAGLGPPRAGDAGVRPDQGTDRSAYVSRPAIPTPAPPPTGVPAIGADLSRRSAIEPQSYAAAPSPAHSQAPACLIQSGRLRYLTLPDVDGRTWDFSQHRGQLVLLDFWGTWCQPCMRALPDLVRLHSQYGDRGLEVVGISCERNGLADGARRVRQVQARIPGMNYRMLLADDYSRCPVQTQFQIHSYPTLVLLDGDGTILWRGSEVAEAEILIRRRLGY
jgi:thiol-disulfide isomerase/thioredoxin